MLTWIYSLYEKWLIQQIKQLPIPQHVGIILDGNRRHALKKGIIDPVQTYTLGAEKLDEVLVWSHEIGIHAITLWVLSIDNLKRHPKELDAIYKAVETKIGNLLQSPLIQKLDIHLQAAGRLDILPESTRQIIQKAREQTATHRSLNVTFALAYGGRQEITDAVRKIIEQGVRENRQTEDILNMISPESIDANLYTTCLPDLDLIIRTSGEFRLSGFLLWQSACSEFYFTDVNWPEMRKIDLLRAIRDYQHRQRRFGL